ncbi:hypothetical protein HWV62_41096 [Athelia sp. TMB]|nr:hypothetical protein HWV62_41096 [Athelia sp. TMB]
MPGECCTDGERKARRFEIVKKTVTLWTSGDEPPPASAEGFVELRFGLRLPEDMTGEYFDDDGQMVRMALPPSFHDMDNGARYIKYSVLAWAAITSGGQPHRDGQEITVSSSLPSKPSMEWMTTWHWGPLGARRHKRTEFTVNPVPDRGAELKQSSKCSSCDSTTGSRLLCAQCESDFTWCWDCLSDASKTHPTDHLLVRIDETGELEHDKTIHATAKAAVAEVAAALLGPSVQEKRHSHSNKLKRKTSLKRSGSISSIGSAMPETTLILDLSAEMNYEVRSLHILTFEQVVNSTQVSMPKLDNFPQDLDIPIVIRIKISSLEEEDLPSLLPVMPWNNSESPDPMHMHDGKDGPVLLLNVFLQSRIGVDYVESELWRWCCWHNLLAESGTHSIVAPSTEWTSPEKNSAGKWEQTAVLSTHIRRDLIDNVRNIGEVPHINTPILSTRFQLVMKHDIAGQEVTVPLSDMPWSSGIFRKDLEEELARNADSKEKLSTPERSISAPAKLQPTPLQTSYLPKSEVEQPSPLISKESPVWDYVFNEGRG